MRCRQFIPVVLAGALILAAPQGLAQRGSSGLELVVASERTMDVGPGWRGQLTVNSVRYHEPPGDTLVFNDRPNILYVILRNTSDSAERIWGGSKGAPFFISFELTDPRGIQTIMKRRASDARANVRTGQDLSPGEQLVLEMFISEDAWVNVPALVPGEKQGYRLRVVFDNKGRKVTSKTYTVIIDGTGIPTADVFEPAPLPETPAAGVVVNPPLPRQPLPAAVPTNSPSAPSAVTR